MELANRIIVLRHVVLVVHLKSVCSKHCTMYVGKRHGCRTARIHDERRNYGAKRFVENRGSVHHGLFGLLVDIACNIYGFYPMCYCVYLLNLNHNPMLEFAQVRDLACALKCALSLTFQYSTGSTVCPAHKTSWVRNPKVFQFRIEAADLTTSVDGL